MSRLSLIVAEDDHFMREWLALTLQGLDAQVVQAANGHELAALLASDCQVDLVISDIRMPGPSGLDVLARAREGGNLVPFLFITGFGGAEVVAAADQIGATVLEKPFSRRDLLARVTDICHSRPLGGVHDGELVRAPDDHG
jgi:DNA-binding response OmpR family regulator